MKLILICVTLCLASSAMASEFPVTPVEDPNLQFDMRNLTTGFIKGLQSDPSSESICMRDISKIQDLFTDMLTIWNDLLAGNFDLTAASMFLMSAY